MLLDVNEGEPVDTKTLSTVQNFRIAIEGLRIALNKNARRPITELDATNSNLLEFNNLPTEEKCHVLFAQALKKQVRNFGAVVAIVDAASVAGLRKHWNTSVPPEVTDLANHCVIHHCNDHDSGEEIMNDNHEKKKTLTDKPVVVFGAGATALVGVSSFSKAMPASSLIKAASLHASSSFKIGLLQLQRKVAFGLSKLLFPSKLVAPGLTTGTKLTASAEKIRAVTHTMIAAAERTSLSAIRTSFYEIMRKRNVRPVGYTPWVSFACSMGACAGLLTYGDGIECAAESVPSVSMIASLGRGLQSLKQASQEVKETSGVKDPSSDAMYPSVGNRSYSVFFLGLALLFFFIKNPPSFLQDIAQQQTPESLYDITVKDISGSNVSLSTYSGKVLLIINVASKCGLTHKNYNELNILYEKYKDKGLEILAFPCNQFLSQEPGSNEEIQEAACTILKAEFPIFDKVEVNGKNVAPLYKFLKSKKGGLFGDSIKWNFTKFLIDRQGNVVQRYAPTTSPMKIEEDIQKLL